MLHTFNKKQQYPYLKIALLLRQLIPPLNPTMTQAILDPDALLNAAAMQFSEGNYGNEFFQTSYQKFLHALTHEANLTPVGLYAAASRIIASLKRVRQLEDYTARYPNTADIEIPSPIIIAGLPRTGTTLLHNLFAADPNNRSIRLWEMRDPYPQGKDAIEKAIAETDQLVAAAYNISPSLVNIHPINARWPDECSWLFRNSFASMVQAFSYPVPSYLQYLLEKDLSEDYAFYKRQLQMLLQLRPGQPLVLKDPCHAWHLHDLLKVFPDAKIIRTHRNPEESVTSFFSLCQALQQGNANPLSPRELGDYARSILEPGIERYTTIDNNKENQQVSSDSFFDINYQQLVKDPISQMQSLYESLELSFTPKPEQAMTQWLTSNRKLSGKHKYSLSDFDYTASELSTLFDQYRDRFSEFLTP